MHYTMSWKTEAGFMVQRNWLLGGSVLKWKTLGGEAPNCCGGNTKKDLAT